MVHLYFGFDMDLKFACSCGQHLVVEASAAGQEFSCPSCGTVLLVPAAEAQARVSSRERIPLRFIDYATASLEQLQQAGLVRKNIANHIVNSLPAAPWETILADHSTLLNKEGIYSSVERQTFFEQREKVSSMNLNEIAQRGANEEPATERQLNFLRSLGVVDESFLSNLGKWQASQVIEYILENR